MYRHEGFWIGDAWYYVDGDTIHMYYLTRALTGPEAVGHVMHVGHAISTDLSPHKFLLLGRKP